LSNAVLVCQYGGIITIVDVLSGNEDDENKGNLLEQLSTEYIEWLIKAEGTKLYPYIDEKDNDEAKSRKNVTLGPGITFDSTTRNWDILETYLGWTEDDINTIITDLYDRGVKYSEDSKYAITLQNAKQILNVLAQEIYIPDVNRAIEAYRDEADEEDVKENTSKEELAFEPKYITIDLSAVKETHIEGEAVEPLKLQIISEEYNNIDWANDWYERENLSLPMIGNEWNHFYDDTYEYLWADDELYIFDRQISNSDTHCLYVLQYPTDKWYINGNNAWLKDGIFYGASVTNGYAGPDSCFMFAYDLEQDKLLWRSADQSYNSMNFVVKGDVILCGYGFTAEDDYLYQINRNTGEILDRLELKKMPDLLVEQDGKLYVHTYSYDYVIDF